jgi:hypothetical protein
LREAFNRFLRYLRILSEIPLLKFEEDSNGFTFMYDVELLDMRIPAQVDMGMATAIHMCRLNYGEDLRSKAVSAPILNLPD